MVRCAVCAPAASLNAAHTRSRVVGRGAPPGSHGRKLREEILHKIEKWQEPPPPKQVKPLSLPDEVPRKRRGGKRCAAKTERRHCAASELLTRSACAARRCGWARVCRARKAKERLAMTELRKQANRVSFGVEEAEAYYGDDVEGLGMLSGQNKATGSVRVAKVDTRNKRTERDRRGGGWGERASRLTPIRPGVRRGDCVRPSQPTSPRSSSSSSRATAGGAAPCRACRRRSCSRPCRAWSW